MRTQRFSHFKTEYLDTDIEESHLYPPSTPIPASRKRKLIKRVSRKAPSPFHLRIYRFRLLHAHRTLRVSCFAERDLNWPYRFEKRLNPVEVDNDMETDEEMMEEEVERCTEFLREAIRQQADI